MNTSEVLVRGTTEDSAGSGEVSLAGFAADGCGASVSFQEVAWNSAAVETPAAVFLSRSRREIFSSIGAVLSSREAEESETQKERRVKE